MEILINMISLSREEMLETNGEKYLTLRKTKYFNMLKKLINILFEERKEYSSDMEFYKKIAHQFACIYIPKLINDYGNILNEETLESEHGIKL